jgi:RND family efflux transporter MFP subunit
MTTQSTIRAARLQRFFASRRALIIHGAVFVIAAFTFTFLAPARSGQTDKKAEQPRPTASIAVKVVLPSPTTFARTVAATGSVSARDELIIGSDASGLRLMQVLVDVGSTVKKGQLLARADDAQLLAQLAQQEALIKQAEAEQTQADANVERAERIRESGVYSIEALQTRRTAAAAARAKLELAIAQKRELDVRLAHTRFVAPADGVIARKLATVGAVVQPGTELFRLIRDGELEWQAELPSHSIVKVQPGTKARIALDDGNVIEATVRLVAPTLDAQTRNGRVHVSLPAGVALKAGSHAQGEILIDHARGLAVPESAVLTRDGYPFVYVVGEDEIARLTRVETGVRQRRLVEVSSGLSADARVVSTGAGFVKDGDLVRIEPRTEPKVAHSQARNTPSLTSERASASRLIRRSAAAEGSREQGWGEGRLVSQPSTFAVTSPALIPRLLPLMREKEPQRLAQLGDI